MAKVRRVLPLFLAMTATFTLAKEASVQSKITRIPLLTAQLAADKAVERVEIKRIDFAPLQKTGLHFHPCPVVGYIAKGTIYFQADGEKAKTLKAGDAFFEPAGHKILHFDNLSSTEPASFVAFYLLGKDDNELIKLLE